MMNVVSPASAGRAAVANDEECVIFCAIQRTGSALMVDDIWNLAGGQIPNGERLYGEILRELPGKPWPEAWTALRQHSRLQHLVMDKVMFHYTPHISSVIAGKVLTRKPPVFTFEPALFDAFHDFFRHALWVSIDRRDIYAQAVSIFFAEQTKIWEIRDAQQRRPEELTQAVVYDRERLVRHVRAFAAERAEWERFYAHYGITPLRLFYEDAVENYPHYLDAFFAGTGLNRISPPPGRRLHKVGDATNRQFSERLREDCEADPENGFRFK